MTDDTLEHTFQSVRRYLKADDGTDERSRQVRIARQEFISLASLKLKGWFNARMRREL